MWNVVKHLKEHTAHSVVVDTKYTHVCVAPITASEAGELGADVDSDGNSLWFCNKVFTLTSEAAYSGICEIRIEGVRLAAAGNRGGHAVQLAGSEKAEDYTETGQRCCPCRRPGSSCDGAGHSRLCCRLWVGG